MILIRGRLGQRQGLGGMGKLRELCPGRKPPLPAHHLPVKGLDLGRQQRRCVGRSGGAFEAVADQLLAGRRKAHLGVAREDKGWGCKIQGIFASECSPC